MFPLGKKVLAFFVLWCAMLGFVTLFMVRCAEAQEPRVNDSYRGYADKQAWHNEFRGRKPDVERDTILHIETEEPYGYGTPSSASDYPPECIWVEFKECMRIWDEQDRANGVNP